MGNSTEPMNREPNPAVVRLFENLTADEIAQWLPENPAVRIPIIGPIIRIIADTEDDDYDLSKHEVIQKLRAIADGSALPSDNPNRDRTRIDRGPETMHAARLFCRDEEVAYRRPLPFGIQVTEHDLDVYWTEFRREYWNEHRAEIAKNYGLEKGNLFLDAFNDPRISVEQLQSFRSLPTFDQLASTLPSILPQIRENKRFSALYIASGFHIAPIATAMKLIDAGDIEGAEFTFTEINEGSFYNLHYILRALVEHNIFIEITAGGWITFADEGKERLISLNYKGKPIRINFALNRSGEKYFRPEYLKEANLVILHDPGNSEFEDSVDLLAEILLLRRDGSFPENQTIIMEGSARNTYIGPAKNPFPATMKQHEISGPYGHCSGEDGVGEIDTCAYNSARVFLLNDPALLEFTAPYNSVAGMSRVIYKPPMRRVYRVK